MSWILEPGFQPFAIAGLVLLGLVVIEMLSVVVGATVSDTVEATPVGEFAEKVLGWLNLGRVPALVLLMTFLAGFSTAGFVLQIFLRNSIGTLPPLAASAVALIVAVPFTRLMTRAIGRIMPRDESYAIIDEQLIGKTGIVTVGPLDAASVGRASVLDAFGNKHFPRVRPVDPGETIEAGARVVIFAREGREYRVVRAPPEGAIDSSVGPRSPFAFDARKTQEL